mmetsp:Transcript_7674/g.10046  ORF Transcript_7674/g.10046 Transcript_7674/m.10046 type:complete len:274 (+) Transcript_7674:364-1185(+)|eukprot:CAMPEP_0198148210 /NCGR_PEP_ID=MMETSP1443-20131203/40420_1 /TAXON_ID=186043 /ORGANISM="Entomoneis sp., Strain CCMP2396" /LENGTH=273 /DNA_ID=CAMNT_0043812841 /DNA_START=280 /DNA_END=1101 /DNA_ORIENTATION=+
MAEDDSAACCNEPQQAFLYLYLIYFVFVLCTGDMFFSKPMRLLATSVHELSHAIMCWITCGRVHKLEVYSNEGGVTHYTGGCRCLIASAGYLGEAAWGMILVILSGGKVSSTIAAVSLIVILLVGLCYSPNRVMVILNIAYAVVLGAFLAVEWFVFSPILSYVTLLFGVYLGTFAITDIFSHLILRSVPGSDAYTLYEESGRCCPPKCVGVWWMLLAIVMQMVGIYLALILLCEECEDQGWFECIFHSKLNLRFQDFDWWPDGWEFKNWDFGH